MDFKGQQFSENLYQYVMMFFSLIAFVSGYLTQSFRVTLIIFGGGLVLSFVLAVPDWPYFNQDPLQWLANDEPQPKVVEGTEKKSDGAEEVALKGEARGTTGTGKGGATTPAKKSK